MTQKKGLRGKKIASGREQYSRLNADWGGLVHCTQEWGCDITTAWEK